MSKEEILKHKFQKSPDGEYNPIHEAMDEFAKQESIEFANFLCTQGYAPHEWMENTWIDHNGNGEYDPSELRELFKQSGWDIVTGTESSGKVNFDQFKSKDQNPTPLD